MVCHRIRAHQRVSGVVRDPSILLIGTHPSESMKMFISLDVPFRPPHDLLPLPLPLPLPLHHHHLLTHPLSSPHFYQPDHRTQTLAKQCQRTPENERYPEKDCSNSTQARKSNQPTLKCSLARSCISSLLPSFQSAAPESTNCPKNQIDIRNSTSSKHFRKPRCPEM